MNSSTINHSQCTPQSTATELRNQRKIIVANERLFHSRTHIFQIQLVPNINYVAEIIHANQVCIPINQSL